MNVGVPTVEVLVIGSLSVPNWRQCRTSRQAALDVVTIWLTHLQTGSHVSLFFILCTGYKSLFINACIEMESW